MKEYQTVKMSYGETFAEKLAKLSEGGWSVAYAGMNSENTGYSNTLWWAILEREVE